MRYQTVEIEGLKIWYREAGEVGSAKRLLHGFPASSHQYRNLMAALAHHAPIHRLDSGHFALEDSCELIASRMESFCDSPRR